MTRSKLNNWRKQWYEASAVISSGERYLPLPELEDALRRAHPDETRWIRVGPASSSRARVEILTLARHGGAAAARLGDLLAQSPNGWDWASAEVTAAPKREGIRRWPRLAVIPERGEEVSADAALWLAGHAANADDPAAVTLEVLQMCGLTLSAGREKDLTAP